MAPFGTVWPATKFRFDANGKLAPAGHTVTNPGAPGSVTVTFNTTAQPHPPAHPHDPSPPPTSTPAATAPTTTA